jgi:hypothetical protein
MHFGKRSDGLHVQVFDGVCNSHEAGHAPHAIQIRKALEGNLTAALVVKGEGTSEIEVEALGERSFFFNHHTDAIVALSQIHKGGQFSYSDRFGVLILQTSADEGFAFSLSAELISPCKA